VNPGLRYLLRRNATGRLRQLRRRMTTFKGFLGTVAMIGFLLLVALPHLLGMQEMREHLDMARVALSVRTVGPFIFLGMVTLTVVSGRPLAFRPPEVDFLFPAPVSRRELLLYNIVSRSALDVLSGLWFAIFIFAYAGTWVGGVLTPVLALVFAGVAAQAYSLGGVAVRARWGRTSWWAAQAAVVGAILAVLVWTAGRIVYTGEARAWLAEFMATPAMWLLSLPVRPFLELYLATSPQALLGWTAASVALLTAVVGATIRVDVAYSEYALGASRRQAERLKRMQSGRARVTRRDGGTAPRVPSLAFLGGAAPLARRQLLELSRSPRVLLGPVFFVGAMLFVLIGIPLLDGTGPRETRIVAGIALGLVVVIPLMIAQFVPYDFRRDLDRIAYLRSLPLSPRTIALGQIFAPVFVLAALQAFGVAGVGLISGAFPVTTLLAVLLVVGPLTWISVAADNAVFLWLPYRMAQDGSNNAQFMGKLWFGMFLKVILSILAVLPAVLVAVLLEVVASPPSLFTAAVAALTLVACCIPLTELVGRAFVRFDLVHDMPAS
jgi:ABC-2 type transport system permease protein